MEDSSLDLSLPQIVEELERAEFECPGGPLKNHIAFVALKNLAATPNLYELCYPDEVAGFKLRHHLELKEIGALLESVDEIFLQIRAETDQDRIVYMLGRLNVRHWEAIYLLCTHSFGFAAMRVVRSMFEKLVDLIYINNNPEVADDFIDYHLAGLVKEGNEAEAAKLDPDYKTRIARFVGKNGGIRPTWTKKSIAKRAAAIGMNQFIISTAYFEGNKFVHSSMSEITSSLYHEEDGSVSPVENENPVERIWAKLAFMQANHFLYSTMKAQIAQFELPPSAKLDAWFKANDAAILARSRGED